MKKVNASVAHSLIHIYNYCLSFFTDQVQVNLLYYDTTRVTYSFIYTIETMVKIILYNFSTTQLVQQN